MSVETFIDTSLLVKLFDPSVPSKQAAALATLEAERASGGPTVSAVVLSEVFHALTKGRRTEGRELPPIMSRNEAVEAVKLLRSLNVAMVPEQAWIESVRLLAQRSRLGTWDALHLGTAVVTGCRTFLTWDTDFPSGSVIAGVRVVHPPF